VEYFHTALRYLGITVCGGNDSWAPKLSFVGKRALGMVIAPSISGILSHSAVLSWHDCMRRQRFVGFLTCSGLVCERALLICIYIYIYIYIYIIYSWARHVIDGVSAGAFRALLQFLYTHHLHEEEHCAMSCSRERASIVLQCVVVCSSVTSFGELLACCSAL